MSRRYSLEFRLSTTFATITTHLVRLYAAAQTAIATAGMLGGLQPPPGHAVAADAGSDVRLLTGAVAVAAEIRVAGMWAPFGAGFVFSHDHVLCLRSYTTGNLS